MEYLSVVIPAHNEAPRIGAVLEGLAKALAPIPHEIIVVDDGSTDGTGEVAARYGVTVVRNPYTKGYGGALKTGVRKAKGEWVLFLDADGQHDPGELAPILENADDADMVIGARQGESLKKAGRPVGRRILHWLAEYLTEREIADLNSGLRVVRRSLVLDNLSLLPNGFSFSTTLTMALMKAGHTVVFVPVKVEAREGSSSRVRIVRDGLRTLLLMIRIITLFNPLKVFLPVSCFLWIVGFAYLIEDFIRVTNIPDGAVLLITSGVIVFFFGILADQISTLRREGERGESLSPGGVFKGGEGGRNPTPALPVNGEGEEMSPRLRGD